MGVASLVLAGLLAMGPQWAIIDLPYPEVTDYDGAGGGHGEEARLTETILGYARLRDTRRILRAKPEISNLRIEGTKASATVHYGERSESVQLRYLNGEWRVVPPER